MNFSIDTIIIIVGWLLLVGSGGFIAFWVAALVVLRAGQKAAPELGVGLAWKPGGENGEDWPSVSVVVPAHNEEGMIAEALASISGSDYAGKLEIIVVADRCDDRTVELAEVCAAADDRMQIVEVTECPEGWSGKCHSCWQGAKRATGDLLLFTDADTVFAPELVRAGVGYLKNRQLDFLSILGSLRFLKRFEKITQPVATLVLMRFYPIHKANRLEKEKRRPFANGQFMLFTAEAYETVGTHEQLKDAILEDLRFARRLSNHGFRLGLTTARDLFTVRMYDSEEDFRRGWKRILIEGTNRNIPRLRATAWRLRMLASGHLIALSACVFSVSFGSQGYWMPHPLLIGAVGLIAQILNVGVLAMLYRLQGAPLRCMVYYPFGCLRVASILMEAIGDLKENRGIEWAQLRYEVDAQDEK